MGAMYWCSEVILPAENWEKKHGVTVVTGSGMGVVFRAVEQRLHLLKISFVDSFTVGDKKNGSFVVFLRPTYTGALHVMLAYICACRRPSCSKKGMIVLLPNRLALLYKQLHQLRSQLHIMPTVVDHAQRVYSADRLKCGTSTSLPKSAHHDCTFLLDSSYCW